MKRLLSLLPNNPRRKSGGLLKHSNAIRAGHKQKLDLWEPVLFILLIVIVYAIAEVALPMLNDFFDWMKSL